MTVSNHSGFCCSKNDGSRVPAPELTKQEAQLMLTKPHYTFSGQSRSPNIVPFCMLGIVSSCAIVTLSLGCAVFPIFNFKKCLDLEIRVRGHSRSLNVLPFVRLRMISY